MTFVMDTVEHDFVGARLTRLGTPSESAECPSTRVVKTYLTFLRYISRPVLAYPAPVRTSLRLCKESVRTAFSSTSAW